MKNPLASFLLEHCIIGDKANGSKMSKHNLHTMYSSWLETHTQPPVTRNAFSRLLTKFPLIKSTSCLRYYTNIRLAMPLEMQPDEVIYRQFLSDRAPALIPVLDAWVADKSGDPLILRLMAATVDRATKFLNGGTA